MAKDKLENKIDLLTNAIEKLIAHPVAPVAPVAPVLPVAPVAPIIVPHTGDHDTLVGLVGSVANLEKKVDAISDKLDEKYTTIEEHKVVVGVQTDHEARLRLTETGLTRIATWGTALVVFIGVIEFLVSKFILK